MTTRKQITSAIVTRMAAIAGVKSAAAWRKIPYGPADLPAILVMDTADRLTDETIGWHQHSLAVSIVVMTGATTPVDTARDLAAALLAAVYSDPTWSGYALATQAEEISLDAETVGDAIAAAQVTLTVTYSTPLGTM